MVSKCCFYFKDTVLLDGKYVSVNEPHEYCVGEFTLKLYKCVLFLFTFGNRTSEAVRIRSSVEK